MSQIKQLENSRQRCYFDFKSLNQKLETTRCVAQDKRAAMTLEKEV